MTEMPDFGDKVMDKPNLAALERPMRSGTPPDLEFAHPRLMAYTRDSGTKEV